MLRYYRIKAYLNANHFVVFDGKKGKTHPHTWEFVATVYTKNDSIVKFTDTEKAIMKVFEPYQDRVLNGKHHRTLCKQYFRSSKAV